MWISPNSISPVLLISAVLKLAVMAPLTEISRAGGPSIKVSTELWAVRGQEAGLGIEVHLAVAGNLVLIGIDGKDQHTAAFHVACAECHRHRARDRQAHISPRDRAVCARWRPAHPDCWVS